MKDLKDLQYPVDNEFLYPGDTCTVNKTITGIEIITTAKKSQTCKCKEKKYIKFKIDCIGNRSFRIRYGVNEADFTNETVMLEPFKENENFILNEYDEYVEIKLEKASCIFDKKSKSIKIYDAYDKCILQIPSEKEYDWRSTLRSESWDDSKIYGVSDRQDCSMSISENMEAVHVTLKMQLTEKIYGLGEQFLNYNQRGHSTYIKNVTIAGNIKDESFINIPFFMSTAGYGIFINSCCPMRFDMGSEYYDYANIYVEDRLMDMFIFVGPSFKDILTSYSKITGFSPKLPRWSYGIWASRAFYKDRYETQAVAERFRKEQIPCDVISVDSNWFKGGPWMCDLRFSDEIFPNPEEMFRQLEAIGFKVCVWQLPCVHFNVENYKFGKERGYFVKHKDGSVYNIELNLGCIGRQVFAHIDFTNPEAVSWYMEQIKTILRMGARVIKADMAELCPTDGVYKSLENKEINRTFSLLYNSEMYRAAEEVYGPGNGIVWARSSYAGGQKFPVVWSGDPFSSFNHMAGSLRGGLSIGMSGHPFWSCDIGGFFGQPSEKLYIRWLQFGMFLSHTRLHGDTVREPWFYGNEALEIFRKYANLRYKLLPYIFSTEYQSTTTGIPFIRSLVLQHQDDINTYDICDQYYFGDSMMIAPIFNDIGERKVYIPEGKWYDFWTCNPIDKSGWINVKMDIDKIPIFIPEGSIIIMGPEMQYVDEKPYEPLEIYYYYGRSNTFRYVNGSDDYLIKVECSEGSVRISDQSLSKNKKVNYHCIGTEKITVEFL